MTHTEQFIAAYTAAANRRAGQVAAMDAAALRRLAPHVKGGRAARVAYILAEIKSELKDKVALANALDALGV